MKTSKDPRHQQRIQVVEDLFAQSFTRQRGLHTKSRAIINTLMNIDPLISRAAPQFPLDKIGKVDLAILRLAIFELIYEKKEPEKVIIDEAIELAKFFGGEGSPPFINGVLGTILQNIPRTLKNEQNA